METVMKEKTKKALITGGAGFIGSNLAARLLNDGWDVTVFDNLSRAGTTVNLDWLKSFNRQLTFIKGDIRYQSHVQTCFENDSYDLIAHLAAQVAGTTSITNPREDFEINAIGTFNLLEEIRLHNPSSFLIYSSTNKVYGEMTGYPTVIRNNRWEYKDEETALNGISELTPLDFHSPYGCSKGAADQYVRDYARIYNLQTVVMRQSTIYGYRQFGIEDQGWIAWFIIAGLLSKPITIYGDGRQTRDVLFIDDLVDAYLAAYEHKSQTSGKAYNLGGGPNRVVSVLELFDYLHEFCPFTYSHSDWRLGDQKTYVSNIQACERDFGWTPQMSSTKGIEKLFDWISANLAVIKKEVA